MNKDVVTFGEIMLRLSPAGYLRIKQADALTATFAGSEANVAVCLANLGIQSKYITKVPDNEIGGNSLNSLRKFGVDTSSTLLGGKRLGLFFVEKGASQRPSKVMYDREFSAVSLANPTEYNWNEIFDNASWFHFSGITPALSNQTELTCLDACRIAKEKGITISCDINYRENIWSREKAKTVMTKLMEYVDICFANEDDISDVFDIMYGEFNHSSEDIEIGKYKELSSIMFEEFKLKKVIISLRNSISANNNKWSGMSFDGTSYNFSKQYNINIIDRIGSGDSFAAGYIYSQIMNYDSQKAIEFAVATSCLKHSIEGDYNLVSVDEISNLMNGDITGRIRR